ncbi:MAG: TA system VapC family ribonuclease toxin [Candidatus Dormibacteria bacterium]
MLVDANILLFAANADSRWHAPASAWLSGVLNGPGRVAIPWTSIGAFLRISTHPRAFERPLTAEQAWAFAEAWLGAPPVWVPNPTEGHAQVLGDLVTRHQLTGNLVSDAQMAALAIEHGLAIYSADTDFARFTEVRWVNPIAG